jgi:hypothetical protein
MRRQIVCLMFIGVVALCVAPVLATGRPSQDEGGDRPDTAVAVQRVNLPASGLRDEAAMVLVGTALIGLASAVRRAA